MSDFEQNSKCLLIAEAGVNHNGRLDLALALCDAAKSSGADVVKFQTWKTENIITHTVTQADYQVQNTGKVESQFDMLKRLELSFDDFRKIKAHCDEIGIIFASTPDESESLDFLVEIGVPFIKVGSGEINNVSYLRYIGSKGLPVILSTGMSNLEDVKRSVDALKEGGACGITLLHCTTSYPCSYKDVNLKAMLTLKNEFGFPVGYSDHTIGDEVAISAVALGARVIEKHFTLDKAMEGPDHAASTEPEDFARMVRSIRIVESCLGNGDKRPTSQERAISEVVTKRIVAKIPIKSGDVFSVGNVTIKRNDNGELAKNWDEIIGRVSKKTFLQDEGITV